MLRDGSGRGPSPASGYAFALVAASIALGVRFLLDPYLGDLLPFIPAAVAVMVATWYGGFGPAIVAATVGGLSSTYFFLPPRGSFALEGNYERASALVYTVIALLIALIGRALHRAREEAEATAGAVQAAIEARDSELAQRRLAEKALREANAHLENKVRERTSQLTAALEAGRMGTWSWDASTNRLTWDSLRLHPDGPGSGRIGRDTIDAFFAMFHPEDLAEARARFESTARGEGDLLLEYRVVPPGGNVRWLMSRGRATRDETGRITGVVGVTMDIGDRKQLETARIMAQKMEALGTLAGGIAHDFNNILMAIGGNAELAASQFPDDHPARANLAEITRAGARAKEIVRRILAFSQPQDAGREVIELQPAVEEALLLLRAALPAMVEIRTSFAAGLPAVRADSSQIHQVVVNLVTNAAHAIGGRGSVEVRLDECEISAGQGAALKDLSEGRYLRLSVADDGCGMDTELVERIFDPFFTTKSHEQGSGLGLSVVHGIVKSHGGGVTVDTEPGKGTTMSVYFPAVERPNSVVDVAASPFTHGSGERILFVDDEESLVLLVTRALGQYGYSVTGFSVPEHALRAFLLAPADFDAVVTDFSMPRMSGFELARAILAERPEIPVVMASGYLRAEDETLAEEIGIRALVLKPSTVADLARTLDRVLQPGGDGAGA